MKPVPLFLNLQINIYPDGSVTVNAPAGTSASAVIPASTTAIGTTPSALPSSTPVDGTSSTTTAPASAASSADGPSESDVRTALLAAVKATDKKTAIGVIEATAGVGRVPDVPADQRAAVIEALNKLAAEAAAEPPAEA